MQLQSTQTVPSRALDERIYDRPPRWGRRFLLAFTVLLIVIIAGFWGWTANSRRQLDRQVAIYQLAGEPIEPGDFAVVGVADDDNAVIPLREAAALTDDKSEAWKKYNEYPDEIALPLTEKELALIRDVATHSAGAFDKIDQAMTRKGVDWKINFRSPVIQTLLPDLSPQRGLARLTTHRALLNYQQGDHVAAMRDIRRANFVAGAVDHQPMLIGYLVATGIRAMNAETLTMMSPGLKIGHGASQVRAADVKEVIAQLLDDKPTREGYRRGLYGERMAELDSARCIADGRLSLGALAGGRGGGNPIVATAAFASKPMVLSDGLLMINHTTAMLRAYDAAPDWPTFRATAPGVPDAIQGTMVRHLVAKLLLPSFDRATQTSFRITAERRMTAIALAARLYAVDHDGKPPAKLEDLVPQFLGRVPLDPFAPVPQPLKYINDPAKPILYSVGEDGLDGGGSELPIQPNRPQQNLGRWDKLDAILHLRLQPRPAPTPEAEEEPAIPPGESPEIYPNEREIRAAATRAAATSPAPAPAVAPR